MGKGHNSRKLTRMQHVAAVKIVTALPMKARRLMATRQIKRTKISDENDLKSATFVAGPDRGKSIGRSVLIKELCRAKRDCFLDASMLSSLAPYGLSHALFVFTHWKPFLKCSEHQTNSVDKLRKGLKAAIRREGEGLQGLDDRLSNVNEVAMSKGWQPSWFEPPWLVGWPLQ